MEILFALCLGIAEGFLAAFIIITLSEFGVTNFIVGRISHGHWCVWCIGFWICVLLTIGFFLATSEPFRYIYIIAPGIGAVVSRKVI